MAERSFAKEVQQLRIGEGEETNGSAAVGRFVRLGDEAFALDDVRAAELDLRVEGEDQFVLNGHSSMRQISRDVADLVSQTIGATHQYPDGVVLMTGTLFAPTQDRGAKGQGFTHADGDIVTISTPRLGALVNRVGRSDKIAPWTFGAGALMRNLAKRGLI